VYASFELRVAQHPSEDLPRVVARVLGYCLVYEADLSWGRGLDEAEDPALFVRSPTGTLEHWVDVGLPSAERMHRASKAAKKLTIVSHKTAEGLIREREKRAIHRAEQITVLLLDPGLVTALANAMTRNGNWVVVCANGELMVTANETTLSGPLVETTLSAL
jgi:uncharacterized protein YaeQ